ncbi:hypothetical protein L7F22_064525 [Adiantum nelumboides]|nr:hypothetical protein [Adiantum nelumboides]
MVGGFPPHHHHHRHQQQQQEARPWRPAYTSSISRSGRCKRHPHQALIGVCSICLKERLLALALELEEEEVKAAHAVDLAAAGGPGDGASELEYLHGLHAAGIEASQAAVEYINNARRSYTSHSSGNRAPAASSLQQLHHHQFTNPYLHQNYKALHRSRLEKKTSSRSASGSHRGYKSFASSPGHNSLQVAQRQADHSLERQYIASSSPPAPRGTTQPHLFHWRTSPNEVSPISLSGLHFISTVKATQGSEAAETRKKKKSTSLWSLLQKQPSSSQDTEECKERPLRKGSVQGSPQYHGKGRGPDSSSMREVHESICRGDASSLLSPPRKLVVPNAAGHLPCRASHHSHGARGQLRRGGHWRSNSCIGNDHSFDTIHEEGVGNGPQAGGTSPSWLSSIFYKKSRGRSKSISTACNSSPDMNAVVAASALTAKYGRFSVDAAAPASAAGHRDVEKQDARFRKKYASLFEESTNTRKLSDGSTGTSRTWLQKEEELQGCHHCEEVKARRMKLASFLAAQMNQEGNEREVFGMSQVGGDQSVQLPARSSPGVSPGRKMEEDTALSPGTSRMNASKNHGGNALVHHSSTTGPMNADAPPSSSTIVTSVQSSSSPDMAVLSPVAASADGAAPFDAEIEEKTQSLIRLHVNVPRSRSWSKSWNKALSPMLTLKGIKAASPSRKKRAVIGDAHQLGMQLTSAEEVAAAPQVYSPRRQQELGLDINSKRAPSQQYSFLSKDYSAFSFYFSPLRRSKRKMAAEVGGGIGGTGGGGGANMSSARVNALSDQAAFSGLQTHNILSRHSVDGSCWPSTAHLRHR